MKKLLLTCLTLSSFSLLAAGPSLNQLTKKDLENIGNEFAVNFSHTAVAAPETNGLWGIEVGLVAGQSESPKLKKTINDAGKDGDDFKNLYTAGLMARVHIPFELFVEATILPEREISDVTVSNNTYAIGWNFGRYFSLPLDLALGANFSGSDISFKQVINNASTSGTDVNSTIDLNSTSQVLWVGASKTFLFLTPYIKVGTAKTATDVDVNASGNGTIFSPSFSSDQKESVSSTGSYFAFGANLQFFLFRFGVEGSQTIGVKRLAGKFSLAF